jgi:Peptidase family C25/Propeptide_C25/Secretion system C-terminal sorting domain
MYRFITIFFLVSFLYSSVLAQDRNDYSIRLLDETEREILVEFNLINYESDKVSVEGKQYRKFTFNGSSSVLEKGSPDIHKVAKSLIFSDKDDVSIEILDQDFVEIKDVSIISSKGNVFRTTNPQNLSYDFNERYTKNEFFPGKLAQFGEAYTFRKFDGRALTFFPFQYNPIEKTVRVYKRIIVKINKLSSQSQFDKKQINASFQEIYSRHFLNFQTKKYTPLPDNGKLLIITHPDFESLLEPFVFWKKQKGISVELVSTQLTGQSYAEIKDFILNYYSENDLSFVLLVGDYNYVSPYYVNSIACDPVYGHLDGNDSYAEVIIGRFSGENESDILTQIDRTIHYEKFMNSNDEWLSKYLLIASNEGPGDDNEYDYEHLRKIKTDLLGYTYDGGDEMYDGSQGEDDLNGNPDNSMVITALNEGRGVFNYTGHGYTDRIITSSFTNDDVNNLMNVNKLPFMINVGCVTGDFAGATCFAESLLRAKDGDYPTGAIAALASTINQSWDPPMSGQDEMMDILVESYTDNIKRTFGGIAINGCLHMNDQYGTGGAEMTKTWTLFGDPSLMIRTKKPDVIDLTYLDKLTIGEESFKIYNLDKEYSVSLTQNDSVIATAVSGIETLELTFLPISSLNEVVLTITGYNSQTLIDTIEVLSNEEPYIALTEFSINTNDGQVDYGDEITLDLSIRNLGSSDISGMYAKLNTISNDVVFIEDSIFLGDITGESFLQLEDKFGMQIRQDVEDGTLVFYDMVFSNGLLSWTSQFKIKLNAPKFKIISTTVYDSLAGNNNSRIDPGEFLELELEMVNVGHSVSPDIDVTLEPNENVFLIENQINHQSLDILDTVKFSIPFYSTSILIIGDKAQIVFNADAEGYCICDTIALPIGTIFEGFESGNLTSFDWESANLNPWIIYDTVEIDNAADTIFPYEGRFALRSQDISHNSKSEVNLNLDVSADDEISFYIRVSSEFQENLFFDYLEFLIDDESQYKWHGEVPWKKVNFPVTQGEHKFTWRYKKDGSLSVGEDAAWIDYIQLPSHEIDIVPPILFGFISEPEQNVRINEDYDYILDFSSFNTDFIEEEVEVHAFQLPDWLSLTKNNESKWALSGNASVDQFRTEKIHLFAQFKNVFANQNFEIKVNPPVSVSELKNNMYSVYPNPFNNEINIEGAEVRWVKIYDFMGKEILSETDERSLILDVKMGVYIIKIYDGEQFYYHKMVKSD